jgi:hypothetical protein
MFESILKRTFMISKCYHFTLSDAFCLAIEESQGISIKIRLANNMMKRGKK